MLAQLAPAQLKLKLKRGQPAMPPPPHPVLRCPTSFLAAPNSLDLATSLPCSSPRSAAPSSSCCASAAAARSCLSAFEARPRLSRSSSFALGQAGDRLGPHSTAASLASTLGGSKQGGAAAAGRTWRKLQRPSSPGQGPPV
jgi:hypothetical protein